MKSAEYEQCCSIETGNSAVNLNCYSGDGVRRGNSLKQKKLWKAQGRFWQESIEVSV